MSHQDRPGTDTGSGSTRFLPGDCDHDASLSWTDPTDPLSLTCRDCGESNPFGWTRADFNTKETDMTCEDSLCRQPAAIVITKRRLDTPEGYLGELLEKTVLCEDCAEAVEVG